AIVHRLRLPPRSDKPGLSYIVAALVLLVSARLSLTHARRNRRVRALEARLGAVATLEPPQVLSSIPLHLRQVRAGGSLAAPDEVRTRALDWGAREGFAPEGAAGGVLRFRRSVSALAATSFDLRSVPCTVEIALSPAAPPRAVGALVSCTMEFRSW